MSLSSTSNSVSITATASQTAFTFNLPYFDSSDITGQIKAVSGAITTLTNVGTASPSSNEFSVTPTNNDTSQGATLTMGTAATVNNVYTFTREVPTTQEFDLQEGASIDPTAMNKAFDRIVAQNQFMKNNFVTTWDTDDDGTGTLTSSCKIATIGTGTAKVVIKTGIISLANTGSAQAATFPTAFETSHVVTLLTPKTEAEDVTSDSDSVRVSAISTTGFSVTRKAEGGTPTLYFLSLGN